MLFEGEGWSQKFVSEHFGLFLHSFLSIKKSKNKCLDQMLIILKYTLIWLDIWLDIYYRRLLIPLESL